MSSEALARLTVRDYLNLKEEIRSRIRRLTPEFVQSAYFYAGTAVGDVSPGLSDADVYVVLKTEAERLSPESLKNILGGLWGLAVHPVYSKIWGVHWIHFDTDAKVKETLANPLALLTYIFRSEFIGGEKIIFPEPNYDKILVWMRDFMAPADEREQLEKWLLSTRVIQGPRGLFYLIDSTIFHLGAWVAVAQKTFPRTHAEAYKLLVDAVPKSRDYVRQIAQIRRNWYDNNDFRKVLDIYFKGIENIPDFEKELLRKLY